jgi:Flp pilus assembly protein TadD
VKEGNATEAIVDCNAALEMDPDNVKAIYRRGCAYILAGRFEDAETDALEALRLSPGAAEIRRLLTAARARHQGQL